MDILSIENKRRNIDHLNIVSKISQAYEFSSKKFLSSKYLNNIKTSGIGRPDILNFDKNDSRKKKLTKIEYHSKHRHSLNSLQCSLIPKGNHKQKQDNKDNFVKLIDDDETLFTNRIGNRSNEYYSPKIHNQLSTKLQILNNSESKIFKHKNDKVNRDVGEKGKLNIDTSEMSELKEFSFVSMFPNYELNQTSENSRSMSSTVSFISLQLQYLKSPLKKIRELFKWSSRKISIAVTKTYQNIRRKFRSKSNSVETVSTMCSENEKVFSLLFEKVDYLTNEVTQTRIKNEQHLSEIATEISNLRIINEKLVQELSETAKIVRSNEKIISALIHQSSLAPEKPANQKDLQTAEKAPSLPPPPPPPMPSSLFNLPKPTSIKRESSASTKNFLAPPVNSHPAITVEDLLKVTLKKASQKDSGNRRNLGPIAKGPVVSLDMLKSVKLKSTKRQGTDRIKSPSRVHPYKSRSKLNLSSPTTVKFNDCISSRVLRPIDGNCSIIISSPTKNHSYSFK